MRNFPKFSASSKCDFCISRIIRAAFRSVAAGIMLARAFPNGRRSILVCMETSYFSFFPDYVCEARFDVGAARGPVGPCHWNGPLSISSTMFSPVMLWRHVLGFGTTASYLRIEDRRWPKHISMRVCGDIISVVVVMEATFDDWGLPSQVRGWARLAQLLSKLLISAGLRTTRWHQSRSVRCLGKFCVMFLAIAGLYQTGRPCVRLVKDWRSFDTALTWPPGERAADPLPVRKTSEFQVFVLWRSRQSPGLDVLPLTYSQRHLLKTTFHAFFRFCKGWILESCPYPICNIWHLFRYLALIWPLSGRYFFIWFLFGSYMALI